MLTGTMGLKKVRISNYKNIFGKCYTPNWSEEMFVILKVKTTVPWTYVISLEFRVKKVLKRKSEKLYVKQKGYDISFNYWIDKKDII